MADGPGPGRPHKPIDKKIFENLCGLLCTEREIAAVFECNVDTITDWCKRTYGVNFSEIYAEKSALGDISIRRAQHQLAVDKKNPTMLIWLGKQRLGQTERQVIETTQNITTQGTNESFDRLGELIASLSTTNK